MIGPFASGAPGNGLSMATQTLPWIGSGLLLFTAARTAGTPWISLALIGIGLAMRGAAIVVALDASTLADGMNAPAFPEIEELSEIASYAFCATGLTALGWGAIGRPFADAAIAARRMAGTDLWPWSLELLTTCDLCGSKQQFELFAQTPQSCRAVMCVGCGLMYSSPAIPAESLDRFFELGFEGDPGARRRVDRDNTLERKALGEEQSARAWALPLIARHLDLNGKRILDLRSRTGTMVRAMMEQGADVVGLDPLAPNVDHARIVNGLDNVGFMPISQIAELRGIADGSFDAFTALTVHVLSHLRSPRRHLRRVFEVLKPGGYYFLDEKHALKPMRSAKLSVFGIRPIHTFHFTEESIEKYLRQAGFQVLECKIDRHRTSAFRHIRIVARKPADGVATRCPPLGMTREKFELGLSMVDRANRHLSIVRPINYARRAVKRHLRRIGV